MSQLTDGVANAAAQLATYFPEDQHSRYTPGHL